MKHVKLTVGLLFISVLLVSVLVPLTNPMTNNESIQPELLTNVLSYESHDYFYIHNDSELTATAAAESWAGNGSPETPFLIQGYEINPMIEDIHIENTRLYFKILDCNITGALGGIYLENVTNAVIQDCLFSDNGYGVYLRNVTGITILGCSFTVPDSYGESGIRMEDAIDCSIESCILEGISGSDAGIYGEFCDGITIYNSTIFDFSNHGIFFGGSYNLDIIDNTIYRNNGTGIGPMCGIYLIEGTFARIEGNNITENSDNGITIDGFFNVTIVDNYIFGNRNHGIDVEWADFVIIEDNWIGYHGDSLFVSGPLCGVYSYYSDYIEIGDNEFYHNAINSISVIYSNFANIYGNYINESYNHGMYLFSSDNATIEDNEIYNSYGSDSGPECGIFLSQSYYASVFDNTLGHNSENGITVSSCDDGEISGNTIFDSDVCGITLIEASGWDISYNVIFDNGGPGIFMTVPTMDNVLYYNDIGWCSGAQVVDEGFGNYWNSTGVGNWYSDYNGTGTYTISGASAEVDYYPSMSLYLGTTTPYEYEVGTSGNTMTWDASALNPGTYELLVDGVSQGQVTWDGGSIAAEVDGLPVGEYNVTIIAYHISGHYLVNQSVLTVVDTQGPTWTVTPQNQVLEYNEPLSYQLQASDPSGIDSWALNSTLHFAISETGLLTNSSFLAPGVYYLEITVTDVYSNSASYTIKITVNEIVTTTTPTETPIDPTVLMLAVGGAGAAIVIVLVVVMIKKKGS